MANLPSNIYSGGAVTFNSQPYAAFYLNELQRKRAKDEALDNYFLNFNKSINPAGMRTQDIEGGWMDKVNGWQSYFQQNRQAIENPKLDRGKAYNQYMAMHNDLLGDTQKSKNLADVSRQYVVPIVSNPDKRTRLQENGVNAIHQHDLSMYDEKHKTLDPSVLEYGSKPFDIPAQKKLDQLAMSGKKMDINIPSYKTDSKGKLTITSYHSTYSNKTLQTIGNTYASAFETDDSFKNAVQDISENQEHLNHYNQVFSNVYGRDIENNHDLAAAWGLDRVQGQLNTQKETSFNPYSPADYEYQREKFDDYKKQGDAAQGEFMDAYYNSLFDDAKNNPKDFKQNGKHINTYEVNASPDLKKLFQVPDGAGHYISPDRVRFLENGDLLPIFFKYQGGNKDTKGVPSGQAAVNEELSIPMPKEEFMIRAGKQLLGQKEANSEVINKKAAPQSQTQPKTESHSSSSSSSKKTRPPLDSYIKSK